MPPYLPIPLLVTESFLQNMFVFVGRVSEKECYTAMNITKAAGIIMTKNQCDGQKEVIENCQMILFIQN